MEICWNQSTLHCTNFWGAPFGMGIHIFWAKENLTLNILNIYGLYNSRVTFWDSLQTSHLLRCENLVIGGNMNFTLGVHELWGPRARVDPLASFFSNLLQNIKMVDLDPQKLKPTWTNRRTGEDRIAKRPDRFLLVESLLGRDLMFKQWMDSGANSDNMPIFLESLNNPKNPSIPFKFCSAWLKMRRFSRLFIQIASHLWLKRAPTLPLSLLKICPTSKSS